jgi:hypothetical protein
MEKEFVIFDRSNEKIFVLLEDGNILYALKGEEEYLREAERVRPVLNIPHVNPFMKNSKEY